MGVYTSKTLKKENTLNLKCGENEETPLLWGDTIFEKLNNNFREKVYNYNYFNGCSTCQVDAPLSQICNFMQDLSENLICEYSIQEPTLYDVIQNL